MDNEQFDTNRINRERPQTFEDERQLETQFVFNPALERLGFEKDKFKHINKNLVLTHLSRKEAKEANAIIEALQILANKNQTQHFVAMKNKQKNNLEKVPVSKSEAKELQRQGYTVYAETDNKYQATTDFLTGKLMGLTSVASGKSSKLIEKWTTSRQEVKQSIRESNEPRTIFSSRSRKRETKN